MNYRTMVKGALAFSLSLIVGTAWAADTQTYGVTFEPLVGAATVENDHNYTNNMSITDATLRDEVTGTGWFAAADDESKIIERIAEGSTQALQLNTESNTLTNKFASDVATGLNTAIAGDGAFFETEVKFVASDTLDAGIAGGTDATKFAIYAYCDDQAETVTTNLVVFHAYYDADNPGNNYTSYTNEVFDVTIDTEVYTKLRIEMKKLEIDEGAYQNVFSVSINGGNPLTSDIALDKAIDPTAAGIWFQTVENVEDDIHNVNVSSLNFKGTGEIDNIKVGTIANYVPDANWTIDGFVPDPNTGNWQLPTVDDAQALFYSNLVVNIDATDATAGRNIVAAWVGTKVTASEAAAADLSAWNFEYDAQNGTRKTYAFTTAKDGEDYLYWWVPITAAEVRTALNNNQDIVKTMVVYTSSTSGEDAQTLTVSICPKDIQINNSNDVAGGEKIKVVAGVEQFDVSWTVANVTVKTGGAAAVAGYFAPNTALVFTPDQGMAITNIDGVAVNYAADAAFTLNVTQSTNITVKAGTVSSERVKPDWATAADDTKFWKWVEDNNVSDYASTDYTAQYLMNVAPNANPVLKIDSITVTAEGSQIVVSAANGETAINLADINGVLNVSVGSTVSELTSKDPDANATFAENKATVIIKTADGAFAKATVDFTAAETKLSQVSNYGEQLVGSFPRNTNAGRAMRGPRCFFLGAWAARPRQGRVSGPPGSAGILPAAISHLYFHFCH